MKVYAKKKPIVIQATQWYKLGDHDNVAPYFSSVDRPCKHCGMLMSEHGWVESLEGGLIVCVSDWIIRGFHGELYPIKNNIFIETYEIVEG